MGASFGKTAIKNKKKWMSSDNFWRRVAVIQLSHQIIITEPQ
jgi:hypothetical protein